MASIFRKWDPAILIPTPPHARNNMCVGLVKPSQRCTNQLPLSHVVAGRDLIHNLSNMYLNEIRLSNLRGGLGGTASDCLCHQHRDQYQDVELKWMRMIIKEAKRQVQARVEKWLDGVDPAFGMGPEYNES